ncbi:glutathione S-transferase family protein [Pelagibius sp.]|uniref:glutathione S-transferase family protein n=1 Tax=Pelagibius sp. TaxID=1931238 RepID=UPI00263873D0|nr:glutathione S-transferase family protein [Pelagibius sp.]
MSKDLVFYTNPRSRGRIVRWMLEEVGAPYETEFVAYGEEMKGAGYRAINPMGKVPAIRHGETVVSECAAICAYMADSFPEAGLAPPPGERGSYYRWLFFAAGPVEAAVMDKAMGLEPDPDQQGMVGYGTFALVMDVLQQALAQGSYIAGDRFTAADVFLGSQINWGLQFGTMEARPGFADYVARLTAREAFKRAAALDDAAMPAEAQ